MGLHGGINILHQKKWHVYNADNRAIVQRDEENHERKERAKARVKQNRALHGKLEKLGRVRGDEDETRRPTRDYRDDLSVVHKPLDDEARYEGLLKQRLRGDEEGLTKYSNKERYKRERGGASERWLDKGAKKSYERGYEDIDKDGLEGVSTRKLDITGKEDEHVNLFEDVERDRLKRVREHEQYLKDIGHDSSKDKCVFSEAKEKEGRAWYLQSSHERREILSFERRGRNRYNEGRDTMIKNRKGWISKEVEEAERQRRLKLQDTMDAVTSKLGGADGLLGSIASVGTLSVAEDDDEDRWKERREKERRRNNSAMAPQSHRMTQGGMRAYERSRRTEPSERSDSTIAPKPKTEAPAPTPPEGHDGWEEPSGKSYGPPSTRDEEWPRLLPRDCDYMTRPTYRPKAGKHRRKFLDSSDEDG